MSKHERPDAARISNLIVRATVVANVLPLDATGSQPENLEGDVEEMVDFVTCVGLGINCPRCGTATGGIDEEIEAHCSLERHKFDEGSLNNNSSGEKQNLKQNSLWCSPCGDFALICSLCQMAVRGAGYFCASCGHGGHTGHMREWFEFSVECSSGCGCRCGELAVTGHYPMSGSGPDRDYQTQSPKDKGAQTYWGATLSSRGIDPDKEMSRAVEDDGQSSGKEYFPYNSDTSSDSSVSPNGSIGSESEYESDSDSFDDTSGNNVKRQSRGGDENHQLDLNDSYRSFNEDWDT